MFDGVSLQNTRAVRIRRVEVKCEHLRSLAHLAAFRRCGQAQATHEISQVAGIVVQIFIIFCGLWFYGFFIFAVVLGDK